MEEFNKYFAIINDNNPIRVYNSETDRHEVEKMNASMRDQRIDYNSRAKISYEKSRVFCFSC